MIESHQEDLKRVEARIDAWLSLHEVSTQVVPQSETEGELVFEEIPIGDQVVQLYDGMPFVISPYKVKGAPPFKLGNVFMAKTPLWELRNINWYCDQADWRRIEPILLRDRGPILVGGLSLRDLQLRGIRIFDRNVYTVPLEYLDNDLAVPKVGQPIGDGKNMWPAIVRINDMRRSGADMIERALGKVQDGLDKMVMNALVMDRDIEGAQLMFLEQKLRQAQTARW